MDRLADESDFTLNLAYANAQPPQPLEALGQVIESIELGKRVKEPAPPLSLLPAKAPALATEIQKVSA